MRTCDYCGKAKPLDRFAVVRRSTGERKPRCKSCCRAIANCGRDRPKGYQPMNPEKLVRDRLSVGLPAEGPTDEHRVRWHLQETQGGRA